MVEETRELKNLAKAQSLRKVLNKEGMKTILKPTLAKIALTMLLFNIASWLWRMYVVSRISDTFPRGFPFQYYLAWGPCPPGEICFEYNTLYFFLDVVIWYLVSAFLLSVIPKRRTAS